MGSRRLLLWRVYVYENNLYSLPTMMTPSYRACNPMVYRHDSNEVHRIMGWMNRDLSVLVRSNKKDVLEVFHVILDMLPNKSLKSSDFIVALTPYFGEKAKHFLHEAINFARSPYEDMTSYECNVIYRVYEKKSLDDMPSTSKAAQLRRHMINSKHNFVQFSLTINNDDMHIFGSDIDWEETETEHPDDPLAIDEKPTPFLFNDFSRVFGTNLPGERRQGAQNLFMAARRMATQEAQRAQQSQTPASPAMPTSRQHGNPSSSISSSSVIQTVGTTGTLNPNLSARARDLNFVSLGYDDIEVDLALQRSMMEYVNSSPPNRALPNAFSSPSIPGSMRYGGRGRSQPQVATRGRSRGRGIHHPYSGIPLPGSLTLGRRRAEQEISVRPKRPRLPSHTDAGGNAGGDGDVSGGAGPT